MKPQKTSSWVIVEKGTTNSILEVFNENLLDRLNTEKYEAIPIRKYLGLINAKIKN